MNTFHLRYVPAAILVFAIASSLISCSSSTEPDEDDGTPPAAVTDLAVASFTDTTVTLIWTATGDDGLDGTADRYELRCSDQYIAPPTWDDATVVAGVPSPGPSGTTESFTVTGLAPESRSFFALSTFDDEGNTCGCGNCVDVICFQDAEVVFVDANLEAAVRDELAIAVGPLHRSEVRQLVDLPASERDIVDLGGIEDCTNLAFLHLHGNRIADLTPLAGLFHLCDLSLAFNEIIDLSPLAGLAGLEHLWMDDNRIADLGPLAGLHALTLLRVRNNEVVDLAPLLANTGLGQDDSVFLTDNPLSETAVNEQIPALTARGVIVEY